MVHNTSTDGSQPDNVIRLIFLTSSVTYSDIRESFYVATSGYPVDWVRGRVNRCRLAVPPRSSVSFRLLDVRGRTINFPAIECIYRLMIFDGGKTVYGPLCARISWTGRTVDFPDSGRDGQLISLTFDPGTVAAEGSTMVEGKLWALVTGWSVLSAPVCDPVDHASWPVFFPCGLGSHGDFGKRAMLQLHNMSTIALNYAIRC